MLKQIIAAWKGETFMKKIVEEFGEMLSDCEYVFIHAWDVLIGKAVVEDIRQAIYDRDISVNKHEREIRRKLLEHLSINPSQDVSGCLAMMSIIKDAERIGDYSKNLFELGVMLKGTIKEMKYKERLYVIQENLIRLFPELKTAFLNSDEALAGNILKNYAPLKDDCNNLLHDLFREDLPTREAIGTALLSRYLKRINSHINNIASGIVYPLDKIDFVRGGLLE